VNNLIFNVIKIGLPVHFYLTCTPPSPSKILKYAPEAYRKQWRNVTCKVIIVLFYCNYFFVMRLTGSEYLHVLRMHECQNLYVCEESAFQWPVVRSSKNRGSYARFVICGFCPIHWLTRQETSLLLKSYNKMANIRAEPTVVKSFVSNIFEVRHLSECNCIDPNDSLEWSIKQKIFLLRAQL